MGHFKDLKFVVECANVNFFGDIDQAVSDLAKNTYLDENRANDAIDFAIEKKYIVPRSAGSILGYSTYHVTPQGKLFLKRRMSVFNEYINSYSSLSVVVSIISAVFALIAIIISIVALNTHSL